MPYPNTHAAHIRAAVGDVRTVRPAGWPEGIAALVDDDGMVSVRADAAQVSESEFRDFLRSRDIDADVEPATGDDPDESMDESVDMMRASVEMGRRDMYDLPEYMVGWLRVGLDNLDRAGSGLQDGTIADAREGVNSGQWSGQKIITAAAWHARHGEQEGAIRDDDGLTPKGVSTYLWADNGSGRGARWLERTAERIKREDGEMGRTAQTVAGGIELRRHVEIGADGVTIQPADDGTRTLHVLRRGPLYDVDSGSMLLDVDADMVSAIVANGNALIAAGQTIPVSVEHGIERGQRGDKDADRLAYGSVLGFEERDGEVYARVRYTAAGRDYLARQVTGTQGAEGEETAVYVSPRVMADFAHPDTGEIMGRVIDVVSLTTGPRQNRMRPVELARQTGDGPVDFGTTAGVDDDGRLYIDRPDPRPLLAYIPVPDHQAMRWPETAHSGVGPHVTMVYVEDVGVDAGPYIEAVEAAACSIAPFGITAEGAQVRDTPKGMITAAPVQGVNLQELRTRILAEMAARGCAAYQKHGWWPHSTLGEGEKPLPRTWWRANHVHVRVDGRDVPILLGGETTPFTESLLNRSNNGPARGEEVAAMADLKTPNGAGDVLLARAGDDTGRILSALDLSRDATAGDILAAVRNRGEELSRVTAENAELARFKADVERKARMGEAATLLSRHGIGEDAPEFAFYRDSLATGGDAAEGVRGILAKRGEVDLSRKVGDAFDAAVKRGAFGKGERQAILSRVTAETAPGILAMIEARADHAHTGTPSPAPGGGADANAPERDAAKTITAVELGRRMRDVADKARADGADPGAAQDALYKSLTDSGVTITNGGAR